MKKHLSIFFLALLLAACTAPSQTSQSTASSSAAVVTHSSSSTAVVPEPFDFATHSHVYVSDTYGFSFRYPEYFVLTETSKNFEISDDRTFLFRAGSSDPRYDSSIFAVVRNLTPSYYGDQDGLKISYDAARDQWSTNMPGHPAKVSSPESRLIGGKKAYLVGAGGDGGIRVHTWNIPLPTKGVMLIVSFVYSSGEPTSKEFERDMEDIIDSFTFQD